MTYTYASDAEILTGRIRREAATIARGWNKMLPDAPPAQRLRSGRSPAAGILADHAKPVHDSNGVPRWPSDWTPDIPSVETRRSDEDIDPLTRLLSLRRHIAEVLNGWCRLVIEERKIRKAIPDGLDVDDMCRFLDRHADWIAEQEYATDCADELENYAARVSVVVDPPRKERHRLGTCPFVVGEPDALRTCGGQVSLPIGGDEEEASCDRCEQTGTMRWWEEVLGIARWEAATIPELRRILADRLHLDVTERTVRNWVTAGRIFPIVAPIGPQPLHRRFDVREVLDEIARWGGSCVMCGSLWEGAGDTCTRCYVARSGARPERAEPRPPYIVGTCPPKVIMITRADDDDTPVSRCEWSDLPEPWCGCGRHAGENLDVESLGR